MPVSVRVLTDDAAALARRYAGATPVVLGLIKRGIDLENIETVTRIQGTKLNAAGPKWLNQRTGRLNRSARATLATIDGNTVRSLLGTNVGYGAVHEFGYQGKQIVRPFTRRQFRTRRLNGRGKLKRKVQTGTVQVRGFTRNVNYRARHMFRDGINEAVAAGGYQTRISNLIRGEFGRPVSRSPRPFPE